MHNHSEEHIIISDAKSKNSFKLLWVTLLNLIITVVQVIGGLISGSLALLSDALHNFGDTSAILIAFIANKISKKNPNKNHTFGYKRVEIIAAFFNSIVLIAICFYLFVEAINRFYNPSEIKGSIMFLVATVGLLVNIISVLILHKGNKHNLNVRAVYLHLIGDTLSSVAVMIGAVAIYIWNIYWVDPLITILVGIYIIYHTFKVVRETVSILMQAAPLNANIEEIIKNIEALPEIENVHHVHLWKLDDYQIHFEAHISLRNNVDMIQAMKIKSEIESLLHNKFEINHVTIQMEYGKCNSEHTI